MTDAVAQLDRLDLALTNCVRLIKKPAYWEYIQSRANTSVDRPTAALLITLNGQEVTFNELVATLGIEAPAVSRKVHEAINKGLVISLSGTDRRVHLLRLSDSGAEISKRLIAAKRSLLREVLAKWSREDLNQLCDKLEQLETDIKQSLTPRKDTL